jgi:hypothetical protein
MEVVGPWGLEPQTSTVSKRIPMKQKMTRKRNKLQKANNIRAQMLRKLLESVLLIYKDLQEHGSGGYGTMYGTIFASNATQAPFLFCSPVAALARWSKKEQG